MPKPEDTIPVSVRMPRGAVERLKQATGMPFSTLARYVLMELLKKAEAVQARQLDSVASDISNIVQEMPDNV